MEIEMSPGASIGDSLINAGRLRLLPNPSAILPV